MDSVKNLALVGHSGSGKTTLTKSLVEISGAAGGEEIKFDVTDEEKERGYSIDLGFGYCRNDGEKINLLDTPGGDEFIEEVHKGVYGSESAMLLVDSEKGIQAHTENILDIAQDYDKPVTVLVNKMDKDNADFEKVVGELRESFDENFVVLEIPVKKEGEFVGVVDVIEEKLRKFDGSEEEVPDELSSEVADEREALLEEVVGVDDELIMKYLEEEEIETDEIREALKEGFAQGMFSPVIPGSSSHDSSAEFILRRLFSVLPEHKEGEDRSTTRSIVFNQFRDPYLGRLSYAKIVSGTLEVGEEYFDHRDGEEKTIQDIYTVQGDRQENVEKAETGDIVALGKLEDVRLGDTLSSSSEEEELEFIDFPDSVFSRAIIPETQSDEGKMSTALRELAEIKATVEYYRDEVTKELILSGMGDTHLDVFQNRLQNGFNVSINMSEPEIPYKRSIAKTAKASYRHKKQSGGRGQYAEVYLKVSPLQRGEGFSFVNEIRGGNIPKQFIPGVEKGLKEALEEGYPITDIEATVYDGDHHPVDSSEMAFKIAAREVCKQAVDKAKIVLLEPIMQCSVVTPGDFTGDIVSDLNGRRARILGTEMEDGSTVIKAEVPQSEVQNYSLELKSLTQGRASFQMEFLKYQKVPANIAQDIMN